MVSSQHKIRVNHDDHFKNYGKNVLNSNSNENVSEIQPKRKNALSVMKTTLPTGRSKKTSERDITLSDVVDESELSDRQRKLEEAANKDRQKESRDTDNAEAIRKSAPNSETFRIMVAADIHLGYMESDILRRDDSFKSFEEVLQQAILNQCDMILVGGDLFHENKPSRQTVFRTQQLLAKYALGDNPIYFTIISDPAASFHVNQQCNITSPNVNVQLPIFSIHGNHDDPTGYGGLSALDLLHQSQLINYFGKTNKVDEIHIQPVVLRKGNTEIALYGLGAVRDERLYRAFEAQQVKWHVAKLHNSNVFHLAILHQNRQQHSKTQKNFLPDDLLPDFLDFVVWGHEHESIPEPMHHQKGFYICQPGSTIATSLSMSEQKTKHAVILEVRGKRWRTFPLPLQTVRPFEMADLNLVSVLGDPANFVSRIQMTEDIEKACIIEIEKMRKAAMDNTDNQSNFRPKLPLLRLRVDHTGYPKLSSLRFGQQYVQKVANPEDMLLWTKKRDIDTSKVRSDTDFKDLHLLSHDVDKPPPIHDFVSSILSRTHGLSLLNDDVLACAVQEYVDRKDAVAIEQSLERQLEDFQKLLKTDKILEAESANLDAKTIKEHVKFHNGQLEQNRPKRVKVNVGIDPAELNSANSILDNDDSDESAIEDDVSPIRKASIKGTRVMKKELVGKKAAKTKYVIEKDENDPVAASRRRFSPVVRPVRGSRSRKTAIASLSNIEIISD